MTITVYGTGCPKCQTTERNALQAVEELGLQVTVEHVREPLEIAKAGVMFTPALAIDGVVRCKGKVPSPAEVRAWLEG